jgi:hypothetical protein
VPLLNAFFFYFPLGFTVFLNAFSVYPWRSDLIAIQVFASRKTLVRLLVHRNVDSNREKAFALIRHFLLDLPLAF